jgi:hypothetical protein
MVKQPVHGRSSVPPEHRPSQRPKTRWEALAAASEHLQVLQANLTPQDTASNFLRGNVNASTVAERFLLWDHGQQEEFAALVGDATTLQKHHVALEIRRQMNGSPPSTKAMKLLDFTHRADEIALRLVELPPDRISISSELQSLQALYPQPALRRVIVQSLSSIEELCQGANLLAVQRIGQELAR